MKNNTITHAFVTVIISLSFCIVSCNDNNNKKPSIKDNSVRKTETSTTDYSTLKPEILHKHILAHFDLEQFKEGKEKLTSLINNYPELIDSLNLNNLKSDFDKKLAEIKANELVIAEQERKLRMPNATKNMRNYKKNNITYYIDKTSPEFDTKECFYAYFTKNKAGMFELFFKIRYINTKWLNIENYIITVDQLDHEITGEITKSETKGKKAYKHELLNIKVNTPQRLELLNSIASGKDVIALYVGKDGYKKRNISNEQKLAIRNVLDAFLFMENTNLKDHLSGYTNK